MLFTSFLLMAPTVTTNDLDVGAGGEVPDLSELGRVVQEVVVGHPGVKTLEVVLVICRVFCTPSLMATDGTTTMNSVKPKRLFSSKMMRR